VENNLREFPQIGESSMTYKTTNGDKAPSSAPSRPAPALKPAGVADRKEDTPPGVSANEEKAGHQWVAAVGAASSGNSKAKEEYGYIVTNQR